MKRLLIAIASTTILYSIQGITFYQQWQQALATPQVQQWLQLLQSNEQLQKLEQLRETPEVKQWIALQQAQRLAMHSN